MNTIYALHGFLNRPSDLHFLSESIHAIDIYQVAQPLPALKEWTIAFNSQVNREDSNILLGYSLGGRLALHALHHQPKLWKAAIFVSTHPGLKNPEEKAQRYQADNVWAQRFLQEPWPELIQSWNNQAVFHNTLLPVRQETQYSRAQLAHALTHWSLGLQPDFQHFLETVDVPILWIVGAHDHKFVSIAEPLHFKHSLSKKIVLEHAGHRLLWDHPEEFKQTLNHFIEDCYAYENHLA